MTQALARETASIVSLRSVSRHRDKDTIFVADVDAIYKYVASATNADDGATWILPNDRRDQSAPGRWKLSISGTGSGGGGSLTDWTVDGGGNFIPNANGSQSLGSASLKIAEVFASIFNGVAVRHGIAAPDSGDGVAADVPGVYFQENAPGSIWTKVGPDDTDWLRTATSDVTEVVVLPAQDDDPAPVLGVGKLYSKRDDPDDPDSPKMLFYCASDGTVFQITSNELSSSTDTAAWHRIGDLFGVERNIGTLDDFDFVVIRHGAEKVRIQSGLMILTGAADAAMGIDIRSNGPDGDPAYVYLTNKQGAIVRFDLPSLGGGTAYYSKESHLTISTPAGFGMRCNVNGINNSGWDLDPNGYMTINAVQLGLYSAAPVAQQTITGSRGASAALADLLTKLALTGLIVDGSSA